MARKSMKLAALGGLSLLIWASPAAAQQQTSQVVPFTRNPQTATQPFPSQQPVQNTQNQQLLQQEGTIRLPQGRPANNPQNSGKQSINTKVWAAAISAILGGLLLIWAFKLNKATPEVDQEVSKDEAVDQKPETPAKVPAKASNPKNKKLNKKAKRAKRKRKSR